LLRCAEWEGDFAALMPSIELRIAIFNRGTDELDQSG
jgi:hypothetical protein